MSEVARESPNCIVTANPPMDSPTSTPKAITPPDYWFGGQSLSLDGRWIATSRNFDEDLAILPIGQGEPRTIPNSRGLEPVSWNPDGRSIFAKERGSLPQRIVQLDVTTGRRTPWRELGSDLSRVVGIGFVVIAPGGTAYAYATNLAATSDLFLVEGLK